MNTSPADLLPLVTTVLAGAAAFVAGAAYGAVSPTSRLWGNVLSRGSESSCRAVALTFDDGPLPGTTDRILDELGNLGVKAAFFVIGQRAREWPDLVKRIHDEGHVIGNHSHEHLHFGLMRRYRYWLAEIRRTDDAIEQIIGHRPALFRPPMGFKHWHIMNAAGDLGHNVVTWSLRARDARATTSQAILDRLVEPARGGDILALHDGNDPQLPPQDRTATREAVRPLVEGLRRRGLGLARLDELLQVAPYQDPSSAGAPQRGAAAGCSA